MAQKFRYDVIRRWEGNPLITIDDIPFPCNTVFNAGCAKYARKTSVSSNVQTDPLSQRKSINSFDNLISSVALSCRSGTFTPTESLASASSTGTLLIRRK